ncbi:MAG: leucine-rich repeat domain-containing protein [Ruminiclostridium sp.]|nr:leucine-rich repeat domain-containing protein [Ruminiclostridium sp.]
MKRHSIPALILCAALMLSGCDADKPAETTPLTDEVTSSAIETEPFYSEPVNFEYEPNGDGLLLTRYVNEEIVVPETINGQPVKSFRGSAIQDINIKKLIVKARIESMPTLCECPLLTEVDLPSSLTFLTPGAFSMCKALKAVNVEPGGDFCSVDGAVYTADMKKLIFVPYAAGEEFTVPEGVEVIADCAMQSSSVKRVKLPSTLREIGQLAFCSSELESIELNAGLKKIGGHAFEKTHIKEIKLPEGLETIGRMAFYKTYLDSIYIPDSVTECGGDAFPYCGISAPAHLAAVYWLSSNENVSFRGDSLLDNAIRQGLARFDDNFIFKDITFDGFPELIDFGGSRWMSVYFYNTEKLIWEDSYYNNFSNTEELDGWVNREMWNILKAEYPPGYSFYAIPDEDFIGKVEFYRVNKTGKLLNRVGKLFYFEDGKGINQKSCLYPEDCTLLWELNEDTAREYFAPIGKYVGFDGPFRVEPNGELAESITADGEIITEMPYTLNKIPKSENVYINGKDILHGAKFEGVSYDYDNRTLILDNVTIEATDKEGISFRGIDYPRIKLIGDNRVVSEEKAAIDSFESVKILGDGTLTVGRMALLTSSLYGKSDLYVEENVTLKEAYPGAFAESTIGNLSLTYTSRLICGTADEPSYGLVLDELYIQGDAVCDINSSDYGIYVHDKLHAPIRIKLYGNGKLNITSVLDGITNSWSGGGEVYLYGNSELNINAGRAGIDINYDYGASTSGIVSLSDESKLTIRSRTACVRGYRLYVHGGELDFASGEGFNAAAIKTEIDGEIEYQEGGYHTEATAVLKLKVKAPETEEEYYGYY